MKAVAGSLVFEREGMIELLRAIATDLENGGSYVSGAVLLTPTDSGMDCVISISAEVLAKP